jgi:mono/diheme cytochrome c family protein
MTTRDREPGDLGDWGVLGFGILLGVVVIGLLAAAYVIGLEKGRADARDELAAAATAPSPATPSEPPAVDEQAVTSFSGACGSCHTLAAAGTTGTVGPNLDDLKPTTEQVLVAIENGGAGTGQMPAGLLTGTDAERVAELVSSAAGG